MKQRISVFLCILLILPTIIGCLPLTALETQAATTSVYIYWLDGISSSGAYVDGVYKSTYEMKVEENQSFNVGALAELRIDNEYTYASQRKDVVYSSSQTDIATVSSKGVVNTKNIGTTEITLNCKGVSKALNIVVVKKGTLGMNSNTYNAISKKSDALVKIFGSGITTSNMYKVSNRLSELDVAIRNKVSYNGFKQKKQTYDGYSYYSTSNELVIPSMVGQASIIDNKLDEYAKTNNPIGTNQSKLFKISSVAAKANNDTFTIKLKSKVTDKQIFALRQSYGDTYKLEGKTAQFTVYLIDPKTGYKYYGIATATSQSKNITVKMNYLKLKKGKVYQLYGIESDKNVPKSWTNGKTVKAK